jgi:NhaP-type Na+/H+ or K+/H+ antiporter
MAFAIYYVVEAVHVSGALAPVACNGAVGRRRLEFAADMRLEGGTAWKFVDFLLISLVFTLIGRATIWSPGSAAIVLPHLECSPAYDVARWV